MTTMNTGWVLPNPPIPAPFHRLFQRAAARARIARAQAFATAAAMLSGAVEGLIRANQAYQNRQALAQLTDRQRADIGLGPAGDNAGYTAPDLPFRRP